MSRALIVSLAATGFALAACERPAPEPPPQIDPATARTTTQGRIVGFVSDGGAHVWRGIPFAQPPVGELRWRAPVAPDPWPATREAVAFGPPCAQFAGPAGRREGLEDDDLRGSEDCLYLNVFAPPFDPAAVPGDGEGLPVMVWIHGGGNSIGDARVYDASRLAVSQDVVVVTVQYRLGVFGWLSHPALRTQGSPADRSGNYGTLDLVRSLEWVRDDISAFGGDPSRVTVFGESAGGTNVYSMLLSPSAAGLFHRAISQSGSGRTTPRFEAENFRDDPQPGAENSSRELLVRLLVRDGRAPDRDAAKSALAAMSAEQIATYLRSQSPEQLLSLFDARFGGMYGAAELIRDGVVLPDEDRLVSFASGRYNQVPSILGTNRDENKLFMMFGSDHVSTAFGLPIWLSDEEAYDIEAAYPSLMWKARGVDEPAAAMRAVQGPSVYGYRFDWDEEPRLLWLDFSKLLGAGHAVEIPFVFGGLDLGPANRFVFDEARRPAARALSDAMMSYWSQFAYTGAPGAGRDGSLPRWKPWSEDAGDKFIVFDTEADGGIRLSSDSVTHETVLARLAADERLSQRDRCALYWGFVNWGRELSSDEYAAIDGGACADYPLDDYPWEG